MEIIIRLTDQIKSLTDLVQVQIENNGINVDQYHLSVNELISTLQRTMEDEQEVIYHSPILPRNCVGYDVVGNVKKVYIVFDKCIHPIQYHDESFELGLPRLLFVYTLCDLKIHNMSLYALKGNKKIEQSTKLYKFPLSNVHQDAKVCMGSNSFPEIKSLVDLETMSNFFFAAPFSDDLSVHINGLTNMREIINKFKDNEFDDELLIDTGSTLAHLRSL